MRRHVLLAALVLVLGAWAYAAGSGDDFKCGPIDCDVMKDHPEKRFNAPFPTEAEGRTEQLDNIASARAVAGIGVAFSMASAQNSAASRLCTRKR